MAGNGRHSGSVSLVLAVALAAGAATPLRAETSGPLSGRADAKATGSSRLVNRQVITFAGSPTVLTVWEEIGRGTRTSWFALSLDGGATVAQVMSTENRVRLRYGTFDPLREGEPTIPEALRAGPENELYLVQFVATPLEEMRAEIRALGGEVLRFLTDNTHVIRMTDRVRRQVAHLPYVRWIGAYHPAYRLDEAVAAAVMGLAPEGVAARYSIECMRVGMEDQQAVARVVEQLGGRVEVFTPDQYRMEVTLTPAQLRQVVRLNEINWVDPWLGFGGPDMDLIRQYGGAVPLLSTAGFLGQGVRGEIHDTGVLTNHQQWNGQAPLVHRSNATDSHGTACYGINFATGTGNATATGLMPQREQGITLLYTVSTQFGGSVTRLTLNTEATDPAGPYWSVFQTSSVGSPQVTNYTSISAEVDDYLFRVDYLSCQSQSNVSGTRSSRPQAWAKNIVAVGGMVLNETLARTDDVWASGASVGPAQDLRIKPELAHSFNMVFTTYSTSTTGYGQFSGTSSATPCTCSHFGLLHQMWHQQVWTGFGGGASVFASRPKSTTARALMINGAYRYPINSPITNNMYRAYVGWGMADLTKLYNDRNKFFIVNANDPLVNAQTRTYTFTVAPGEPEFRVTMVYPDPMGNTAAAQQRINDLTLKVTSPTGTVYWGNNGMVPTALSGAGQTAGANWSVPGGGPNTYDTVENVFIQNPEAGTWTVEIIASQVVGDGYLATPGLDAVYSLVVSNVQPAPPPPTCYANCDGSTAVPFLNVADFTCFLSRFAAGDSYANCDGSTTPPVLNVADLTCFLSAFAAGCSAP